MAVGDDAAAAGMDLVPGSTLANTIDTEINKTRDYIAQKTVSSASSSAGAGVLVTRDSGGKFGVPTPTAGTNPTNKDYVDNKLVSDSDSSGVGSGAGKLARFNSAGQLGSQTPTNPSHLTTKQYVDELDIDQWQAIDEIMAGYFHSNPWSRDITGTRRAVWMSQPDGGGFVSIGYSSSSRHKKQNIRPAELTPEQLRGIPVVLYRYRKAVAAERAGKIDHAATEIGTLAEDLHALDLWQFVIYEDGKPAGVHYDLLSLAALSLAQHLADRLDDLESRLAKAGI